MRDYEKTKDLQCMMAHALASTTLTDFPSVSGHFTHCWDFRSALRVNNSIVVAVPIYSISDLVFSSFGFSKAHLCFAFFFAASDISFQISGHTSSGREVVCFLVSPLPDHVYLSGGVSFNRTNLVKPVHASDNSLSIDIPIIINFFFINTSRDVNVVLVTSMYFSGIGNDSSLGIFSLTLGFTWWR